MKPYDFKKIIGWLGIVLSCPICGVRYNFQNIRVIESEQNEGSGEARILIHSDCEKCKSSVMFNVDINGPDIFSIGVITDLTSKDSSRFSKLDPISVDDVIAVHTGLKKFDGDLVKAFGLK